MANVLLAWPNLIDGAVLSGGAWQIALPALQDRRLARVARTTDLSAANTQFTVDLKSPTRQQIVAIVNHNLTTQATWRVRLSNDATFSTSDYDSGWMRAWPVIYTPDMLEWEDDNWWEGTISEADRAGYPALLIFRLDRIYLARYLHFEFRDAANPDGYLQFGRPFISTSWQPAYNMSYGATAGWSTDTTMQRSLGGTPYFDRKSPRRTEKFSLDFLSPDEAWGKVFEMHRVLGTDGEVLVAWDVADPYNLLRFSFLGHLTDLSPATAVFLNNFSNPITIEELT